jgi:hypothetical protein
MLSGFSYGSQHATHIKLICSTVSENASESAEFSDELLLDSDAEIVRALGLTLLVRERFNTRNRAGL